MNHKISTMTFFKMSLLLVRPNINFPKIYSIAEKITHLCKISGAVNYDLPFKWELNST